MAPDLLIVGGGVIGLSIAWRAARAGARVTLLERGRLGRESSWAAGGILPRFAPEPGNPLEALMTESAALYPAFVDELQGESGIDVEYERIGELLSCLDPAELPQLRKDCARQRELGEPVREIVGAERPSAIAAELELHLMPNTAVVRPPRLLDALEVACRARDVELRVDAEVASLSAAQGVVDGATLTSGERVAAGRVVVAAGAWTSALVPFLGEPPPIRPIRGQIALLRPSRPILGPMLSFGPGYLVPRRDGRVLVGSTMEDVGFDARTTARAIKGLLEVACRAAPALADAEVERTWAGLRPATPSGAPIVEAVAGWEGLWLAAGHTRQGILLAPHTAARVVSALSGSFDPSPSRSARLAP